MKRFVLSYIIFAALLFMGIAIMIKPTTFVSTTSSQPSASGEFSTSTIPRGIIILGSAMTISGLLGLSIQGFRMFKVLGLEETNPN